MNQNFRIIGLTVALLVMAFCGYQMTQVSLFGWLTLPFLLAFWAFIVLLTVRRYNLRWLAFSTLSGALLVVGFPMSPLTPLMFVAFVPLLMIEKEITAQNTRARQNRIVRYAFNAFVIYNIGATWWVGNAGLVAGMIANFLNAFFMCLPFWLFHKTNRFLNPAWSFQNNVLEKIKADNLLKYTAFVAFWLGFEYVHLNWEISWAWLTLGNAFAQYPSWVQWYELTGVFGGSLWILLLNVLFFRLFESKFDKNIWSKSLGFQIIIWIVTPSVLSLFLGQKAAKITGETIEVVSIQPNFEPFFEKFDIPESIQINRYLELAASKVDSTTDYFIFPETSFDLHNIELWQEHPMVGELRNFVRRYPRLHLVFGVDALKIYERNARTRPPQYPLSVREFDNRDGTFTLFENYNAATQIASANDSMPLYKKSKLVPGPENLPYGRFLSWLKPLFKKFGGTVGGLGRQPKRDAFLNQNGRNRVAPVVCYESIYGEFCTGYVRDAGAQALFVVTNDGWWDNTPAYRQHAQFAALRAIELRRPVVRSANMGHACFVDHLGQITEATPYGKAAAIKKDIMLNDSLTVYARLGDVIGRMGSWLSVGFLIGLILSFFIKRRASL